MAPVIRIDEDVWKELQKKAEPLVDTPNSVLRKLLKLDKMGSITVTGKTTDIELKDLHSPRSFALIPIPKETRSFFPGYKVYFDLETDIGTVKTRVTSAPAGTPIGDPASGAYIQGNLTHWYEKHTELKPGDKLIFEAIEPGKTYKLSVHHS